MFDPRASSLEGGQRAPSSLDKPVEIALAVADAPPVDACRDCDAEMGITRSAAVIIHSRCFLLGGIATYEFPHWQAPKYHVGS